MLSCRLPEYRGHDCVDGATSVAAAIPAVMVAAPAAASNKLLGVPASSAIPHPLGGRRAKLSYN